jgi:hypothetical protein
MPKRVSRKEWTKLVEHKGWKEGLRWLSEAPENVVERGANGLAFR